MPTCTRKQCISECCCIGPQGKQGIQGKPGPQGPPGGTPAGDNLDVQFNNNGVFGASNDFQYDNTTKVLSLDARIDLKGSTSGNAVALMANATTAGYGLVLPPAQGLANTVLENDGGGGLIWGNKSEELPGGVDKSVQFNDGGVFEGDADLLWDKTGKIFDINGTLRMGTNVSIEADPGSAAYSLTLPPAQGSAITILQNDGSGVLTWVDKPTPSAPLNSIQFNNAGNFDGGTGLTWNGSSKLAVTGDVDLVGTTSGSAVSLNANASTAAYGVTLPAAQGAAGTTLRNDGSGVMSWVPAPTPASTWEWIIHSTSNTGSDQAYTYCHQTLNTTGQINSNIDWTSDATAIVDNTYFTFSGTSMTCTTDIPAHLLLRIQVFVSFAINPGSSPQARLIPRLNGNPIGLDGMFWSGVQSGQFVVLKINESIPAIVSGDVISLNITNSTAQINSMNCNFKAWLQP